MLYSYRFKNLFLHWNIITLLVSIFISFIIVLKKSIYILPSWQSVKGFEAYSIAKSISVGEGFSFFNNRWLFDANESFGYHATAWVDPLYTYILAFIIIVFKDHHQIVAIILNIVLLFFSFLLIYYLGKKSVSPSLGLLAVLLLALNQRFHDQVYYMNNTMLASILLLSSCIILLIFYKNQTYKNACLLGLMLGITCLGCPSTQLFIPITCGAILVLYFQKKMYAFRLALITAIFAILIISPWTVRNYIQFNDFIPVRNGSGQIIFIGVVALAGTVEPDKLRSSITPPWSAATPREAMKLVKQKDYRRALERFQMDYMRNIIPDQYLNMNESQRDAWFLNESKNFIVKNPKLFTKIAFSNLEAFIKSYGNYGVYLAMMAIIAGMIGLRQWFFSTTALWIAVYVIPFLFIVTYFSRYRTPIEPLITFLAAYSLLNIFHYIYSKLMGH
jgi:hypothetical protein